MRWPLIKITAGYTKMAERSGSVLQMNEDLDVSIQQLLLQGLVPTAVPRGTDNEHF